MKSNNTLKRLKNRNSNHNQSNQNGIYNQYIQEYKYYFDNTLNKCKYENKYNSELKGECVLLDVSEFNQKNGDEKRITTLPNSGLKIGDVINLTFAEDLTECWIIEDKENLAIPSHDKFTISPLYFPAIVSRNNGTIDNIDTKVVNDSADLDKKTIYYSPLINKINIGDYVKYKDNTICLITNSQSFTNYPYGKGFKCNQTFKWKDKNGIHEFPCYCKNDSYGVKDTSSSDKLSLMETKLKIYIQYNEETKNIKENLRVIFNHREDIYKVISASTVTNDKLLILTCGNDTYQPQHDDLENNLAYNKLSEENIENPPIQQPTTYEIIGENRIIHKNNYTYKLSPSNSNCVWYLDKYSVELEIAKINNQDNDKVSLYAYETLSSDTCVLYAKDGNEILAQKEITIVRK